MRGGARQFGSDLKKGGCKYLELFVYLVRLLSFIFPFLVLVGWYPNRNVRRWECVKYLQL